MLTFASMMPRSVASAPVYTAIGDASGVAVFALVGMWALFGAFRTEVRSLWQPGRPHLHLRYARARTTLMAFSALWFCLYLPRPVCGGGGCAASVQGVLLLAVATLAAALVATNVAMSWRQGLERLEAAAHPDRPRGLRARA